MRKTIGCCLSTIITLVVLIVGVFFGGTYFAYTKYAQPYLGLSYWQVMGLVPGLYKAKESKIVTQPFNETTDLESFDAKLKSAMFIDQNSDFSIAQLIGEMLGKETTAPEPVADNEPSTVANNKFLDLLNKLNFDFSTLKDYETITDPTIKNVKGVLSVTDKEIAAFVSSVFDATVLPIVGKGLDFGVKLEDVINVKQVIVENPTVDSEDVRLTATIGADLKSLLTGILENMGIGKYASLITNVLPKRLFVTMTIAPYDTEVLPKISLNEYSDEKMNTIFAGINNILNYSKSSTDVDQVGAMFTLIDTKIKSAFATVEKYASMEFVGNSANLDAIQMMMTTLKLNSNVTKENFLTMISFLQCRDLSALNNTNYDKTEIDTFFVNFKNSFAIRNDFDINKNNFTKQLSQVHNQIDTSKIDFNKKNIDLKAESIMKYDALAALFESIIKTDGNGNTDAVTVSTVSNLFNFIKLREISMKNNAEYADKERVTLIIEVPFEEALKAMVGSDNALVSFAMKILPSTMFITAEVNLNCDMIVNEAGEKVRKYPSDSSIIINDLSREQSRSMLETMVALIAPLLGESAAEQFKYDKLCEQIGDLLTKGINQIEKGATAINVVFNSNGMLLPTMYEMVQSAFKLQSDNITPEEMPDEIRLSIKGVQQSHKDEFAKNITFGSDESHKDDMFANIIGKDDLNIVPKREMNLETGTYDYFFIADTELELFDKAINQSLIDKQVNTATADIKLMQTMFVNTLTNSEVLESEFYRNLIEASGFTGDVIIQTVEVLLKLNISNPIVPKSIFVTYVFNPRLAAGEDRIYMVLNGMDAKKTEVLEGMINSSKSSEEKPFNFIETIDEATNKYMGMEIKINLPSVNLSFGENKFEGIKIKPINKTLNDIIICSNIENVMAEDPNYLKGSGMFIYQTSEINLDFTESVNSNLELKEKLDLYFDIIENLPIIPAVQSNKRLNLIAA